MTRASHSPTDGCTGATLRSTPRFRPLPVAAFCLGGLVTLLSVTALMPGCAGRGGPGIGPQFDGAVYPPPPETPRIVALGNIRAGARPSKTEVDLAMFLFGAEPEPPLGLIKPTAVVTAPDGRGLLVCDVALGAVLRWDSERAALDDLRLSERPDMPAAVESAGDKGLLIVDTAARAVLRYGAGGELLRRYRLDGDGFRPADALQIDGEVWVSNIAAHRLDVFDAATGAHRRSIGGRGRGPGQFGIPLGLARTPDGNVCVVDMLNARVQLLDAGGTWLRDIGGPGNRIGRFGRPKDVAVGPDGTIFVVDAASQRVHAFSPDGRPLLAFPSAPASGAARALALPHGVDVAMDSPVDTAALPAGFEPAYYVLVAEQLRDPGIRVYAWSGVGGRPGDTSEVVSRAPGAAPPRVNAGGTRNPHWSPDGCSACHRIEDGRVLPIAGEEVDTLCLSCHDGTKAQAESHPIGRLARGPGLQVPDGWTLVDERLGCLTCHDVKRQCDRKAERPAGFGTFLRGELPGRSLDFCTKCHVGSVSARLSPHVQLDAGGAADAQRCLFCHNQAPELPNDGRRQFQPDLRAESSSLCLGCHTRHWDYAQPDHVDRAVPEPILQRMLAVEAQIGAGGRGDRPPVRPGRQPRVFPLGDGKVTCYTCHNPHQAGLFPPGSELASQTRSPTGATYALRADGAELCLVCHEP